MKEGLVSERKSLSFKDWAGIGFSLMALLLSGLSFYFSNLRIKDSSLARVVEIQDQIGENGHAEMLEMTVPVVNAGNRPSVILAAWYGTNHDQSGPYRASQKQAEAGFPLLLPPRDIQVLRLKFPVSAFAGFNKVPGPEDVQKPDHILTKRYGFLTFATIDSRGEVHEVSTPAIVAVDMWNGENLADFNHLRRAEPFSLFR
jgi:hypothetical protein